MPGRRFTDEMEKIIADEYQKNKLVTLSELGERYKCSLGTISDALRRQNVSVLSARERKILEDAAMPAFSDLQYQVLIGNLLGDAFIEAPKIPNANCGLAIGQKLASKEYVEWLYDLYAPFSGGYWEGKFKKPSNVNGRISNDIEHWNGEWCYNSKFRTTSHPFLRIQRQRWYPEGIKIVPRDIILTWIILAIWAADDGSNSCRLRCFRFCTNGFTREDVEFLAFRLKIDLDIEACVHMYEGIYPVLDIYGDSYDRLLQNISIYFPWKCFAYKMKWRPSKNPNTSGRVGVSYHKRLKKWTAIGNLNDKGKHLGYFDTFKEAVAEREKWEANPETYKYYIPGSNNTSGFPGVHWCNERNNWVARGKYQVYIGRFENREDAIAARKAWNEANK